MSVDLRDTITSARRQQASGAGTVMDILLRASGLPVDTLVGVLSSTYGLQVLLDAADAVPAAPALDRDLSKSLNCALVILGGSAEPVLAMADPFDDAALRRVSLVLGRLPVVAAASGKALEACLGQPAMVTARPVGMATELAVPSGPVIDFVNAALKAAFSAGASDVHFECDRSGVTVKLRQDGVMMGFARMDDPIRAEEVISRIKVLAQLDITERRTPQDGRFRFAVNGESSIDLRVSIMPSVHGEDAVLRLLDKAQLRGAQVAVSLSRLGFDARSARTILDLAELPHGMLLVTGPTGSGKTTTVYAVLSEINSGIEKIITIEDPVEYELAGVLQIPVNERKGLTFAKGLRSILRHDPDRILVGEIRDSETAEIAVQSALTGHQVFTTVHANSVFDVTGRFRHFGLDMFGFMSSLNGLVVQRLVRKLCPDCSGERLTTEREAAWLGAAGIQAAMVPKATGCASCHGTGYRGRIVLAEVHTIDDRLRDLVTGNAPVSEQRAHVAASGVAPLSAQGAAMVRDRVTTAEEIKRVVGW